LNKGKRRVKMADRERASKRDLALLNRFPELFRQWDLSSSESCMGRGICVGPGWYQLLLMMSVELQDFNKNAKQNATEENPYKPVEYGQIKEKFGSLRVYIDNYTEEAQAIVRRYEWLSREFCEFCGGLDRVSLWGGWIQATCHPCSEHKVMRQASELYAVARRPSKYSKKEPMSHEEALEYLKEQFGPDKHRNRGAKYLPEGFPESVQETLEWSLDGILEDEDFLSAVREARAKSPEESDSAIRYSESGFDLPTKCRFMSESLVRRSIAAVDGGNKNG
jgi:hypothetical protein